MENNITQTKGSTMNDFIAQIQCDELTPHYPTQQDWAEYGEYLESIGYDHGDDDWDEDPDANYGFQNLDTDYSDDELPF